MEIILILGILILGSLYILISKKTEKIALIALALAGGLSIFFLMDSLEGDRGLQIFNYGMIVFFLAIALLITWASSTMVDYEIEKKRQPLYYGMILTLIASLSATVYFDNLIVVYVALEISAFLSAGLVMIKPDRLNFRAGVQYLLLSILASAFFLIGMVIIYRITNTFSISGMRSLLEGSLAKDLIRYGFIFIFIGLAFKSALFPFHIWLPAAHGSAPSTSSAILSSLVLKSYIGLFIKLIHIGFGIGLVNSMNILPLIRILGVSAMIYGSILAIMQRELKGMMAYSSIAQIGYIYLGIGLGTPLGLAAAIFHIIAHGITKACLFLSAGKIINLTGHKKMDKMIGLARSLPITMGLYTICALSMIGIPLFVGFISKWNFAHAIMDGGNLLLILVLSLSSLLNGLYYLPLTIRSYFNIDESREKPMKLEEKGQAPLIILGLLVIITGIFSSPIMGLINNIVERLV